MSNLINEFNKSTIAEQEAFLDYVIKEGKLPAADMYRGIKNLLVNTYGIDKQTMEYWVKQCFSSEVIKIINEKIPATSDPKLYQSFIENTIQAQIRDLVNKELPDYRYSPSKTISSRIDTILKQILKEKVEEAIKKNPINVCIGSF